MKNNHAPFIDKKPRLAAGRIRNTSVWACSLHQSVIISSILLICISFDVVAADRTPNDPYFHSKGAWKQKYLDQWGLRRIGFTPSTSKNSAWNIAKGKPKPVVIAVIDSGIDYLHPDIDRDRLWVNVNEKPNKKDDDKNGYVDDLIGWDFVDRDNNPYDLAGHGTHTAGIIAAATGNGEGIAGVNSNAKIMVLRVLNFIVQGRGSRTAEAIYYAVDNGARVINLSLGGHHAAKVELRAIEYAHKKGVVVVVASGNEGIDTGKFGIAGLDQVITVGASDHKDKRAAFSNWGKSVDVVAPGWEILSLRARRTDMVVSIGAKKYKPGTNIVGAQRRYYRASGTSFAAPFVSGVASLIFANNPKLTAKQVSRMIIQSARDIEVPGFDQYSGYGLLDARAALTADPEFFIEPSILGVKAVRKNGKTFVQVIGTANADKFQRAWVEIGKGEAPGSWNKVIPNISKPVTENILGAFDATHLSSAKKWVIRIVVQHKNSKQREFRFALKLG